MDVLIVVRIKYLFILVRLSDVRTAISGLITKLEVDPHLNWHSFLDSYAVISGQVKRCSFARIGQIQPRFQVFLCNTILKRCAQKLVQIITEGATILIRLTAQLTFSPTRFTE